VSESSSLRERVARTRWRRTLAARRPIDTGYRVGVGLVGTLVVAFGIVTIPLPGPGWLTVIAVALGMPIVTYFIFERWFLVPLPKGPIEEWLGL